MVMYTPEHPPSQVLPNDVLQMLYEGSSLEEIICTNAYELGLAVDAQLERKEVHDALGEEAYEILYDGARLLFALVRERDGDPNSFPDGAEPPATRPIFDAPAS